MTSVYGFNDRVPRYDLWQDLQYVFRLIEDQPWGIMGDFNIVRRASEKLGGNAPNWAEMQDFNDCINNIQVVEMNTKDVSLTWDNQRDDEAKIKCRIDRVICNEV